MSLKRLSEIIVRRDMYGHMIGVHYRGSDSYQTRLGAFFTLVTYVLMVVNMVELFTQFLDGSNQDEKFQSKTIDRFEVDPQLIAENQVEILAFIYPPVKREIGTFEAL